jgi:hypothetical protein
LWVEVITKLLQFREGAFGRIPLMSNPKVSPLSAIVPTAAADTITPMDVATPDPAGKPEHVLKKPRSAGQKRPVDDSLSL